MPTLQVDPGSDQELQMIADVLGKSRKVVVVTGAGISTNCGIPDFRSENGLYSLIQAQYDTALKNPPWEHTNTFDIDDRPKKKRKQWFYEVVAPDGTVVDVIDEDLKPKEAGPDSIQRPPSRSKSSDTTTSNSRSSTPGEKSSDSSLSSCPSLLSDPIDPDALELTPKSQAQLFCPPQIEDCFLQKHQISPEESSPRRRSCRFSSPQFCQESTITAIPQAHSAGNTRPPSRATSLPRKTRTPLPASSSEDTDSSSSHLIQRNTLRTQPRTLHRADSSFISATTDQEEVSTTQSSQTSSRSLPNLKGRDLFDCMVWNDPFTTSIFYMFISSLRQRVKEVRETSETHKFIRVLRDGGRLVRSYTQNIDVLEEKEGLSTDLSLGPGNRGRFSQRTQRERLPELIDRSSAFYRGVECVLLHGSLVKLRCGICASICDWDEAERDAATLAGTAPDCPSCTSANSRRTSANRRQLAIGRLRPDIVLYGEEHPCANLISPLITHDLSLSPDVLLIMGTSLKVHGLKVMVREFAKAVHNKGGKVVFVNITKPSESAWGDVIDYWVSWDCDEWVSDLKERRADIWLPQGAIKEDDKRREPISSMKPLQKKARQQCLRDDKNNGVYMTFKIMDTLSNVPDYGGRLSRLPSRKPYWPPTARQSNVQSVTTQPVKRPSQPKKSSKATTISKPKTAPEKEKINSKKRKSHPTYNESYLDNKENLAYKVAEMWARMKEENPNLASIPYELKLPFSHLSSNMPEFFKKSFPFDSNSNHLPNVVGISSLAGMNLGSLPPSDTTIHPVKSIPKPIINHSYGTRASRRWSAPEEMVADCQKTPLKLAETSNTIVVDDPMTPSSQRIKRISSIGNLVSSPEDEVEIWHDASEVLT